MVFNFLIVNKSLINFESEKNRFTQYQKNGEQFDSYNSYSECSINRDWFQKYKNFVLVLQEIFQIRYLKYPYNNTKLYNDLFDWSITNKFLI